MKLLAGLAALVSLGATAPQAPTPLDVQLQMDGNSAVKATITNNGKDDLKIFRTGTILDKSAIQKTRITGVDGKAASFEGFRQRITTKGLKDDAFERIPAGQSIEVTFNVGEVHDLSSGGKFDIHSSGVMHFANDSNNTIIGSVPYHSNSITANINGSEAGALLKSFQRAQKRAMKRTNVQSDCTGNHRSVTDTALNNCQQLASSAQSAARSNDAKVKEYFKDSSAATKNAVADVFGKAATECGSTGGGVSKYYCTDISNQCQGGVLAYTYPGQSYQAYCGSYFEMPPLTSQCHAQDQATTNLHETTHLTQIKGTTDNGYGYDNAMKLDTQKALDNADTYALFANAIKVNC
ncbi:metallo-endopeptidase [Metarhizium brunneum]